VPRLLGVDIPKDKKVWVALTYLFGIGYKRSRDIIKALQLNGDKKAKELTDDEVFKITSFIQNNYKVEGELRRDITQNIRRLMEIGSYRGSRHKKGLPVRGQRTRCNARTRKGPRPRVGGIKKKPSSAK